MIIISVSEKTTGYAWEFIPTVTQLDYAIRQEGYCCRAIGSAYAAISQLLRVDVKDTIN